jgi:CBS domain-containing protein
MSASTAPAATTDVLKENRARGPLNTTTLGIVAMDDAVALILYAIVSAISHIVMGTAQAGEGLKLAEALLKIIMQIAGSMALGLGVGFLLRKAARFSQGDDGRVLSFSLGTLIAIMALAVYVPVDGILCAMSVGFYITNWAPVKVRGLLSLTEKFTPPIYVLFFVLVGAKLDIWAVSGMLLILALVYVLGRTLGKSFGATVGAVLSKAPAGVRKYMPFCLLSQAGVSIGLSIDAGSDFPGTMGQQIMLIITATTFIVQLIGPLCVRHAVIKSGEAGLDINAEDITKEARVSDMVMNGEKICSPDSSSIVNEADTVRHISETFSETPNLNYVVRDREGKLTGLITVEHLKEALYLTDLMDAMMAEDIMDKSEQTCSPDESLADVIARFDESGVEALPITDKSGKALGIVERAAIDHYIHARVMQAQLASEKLG